MAVAAPAMLFRSPAAARRRGGRGAAVQAHRARHRPRLSRRRHRHRPGSAADHRRRSRSCTSPNSASSSCCSSSAWSSSRRGCGACGARSSGSAWRRCVVTGVVLAGAGAAAGRAVDWPAATIVGFGLALSSTAFAMQILEQEGTTNTKYGQTAFSILLFQDLAIVPLLALIPLLAPGSAEAPPPGLQQFADRDRRDRRAADRRALSAQPAVPHHRQYRRQGGDDRRRTAGRARIGDADAAGRPVDGDGRLRRRRHARRILLPARARGRHRAVPRHPARPVLHGRRPVARARRGHRELGDDPDRRADPDGGQGAPSPTRSAGCSAARHENAVRIALAAAAGRRVRLRAVFGRGFRRDLPARDGVAADRHRDAVDGDDAAVRSGDAVLHRARGRGAAGGGFRRAPAPTC